MEEFVKRILNYLGPKFVGSAIVCLPVLVVTALVVLAVATYRDQPFSFIGLALGPSGPRNIDPGVVSPPVGSIIAYYGNPTDLPPNWRICDGSLISDQRSKMFNGKRIPELTDNRFLMGVRATEFEEIAQAHGGRNDIPDGSHIHSGTAGRQISQSDWGEGIQFQRDGPATFSHSHPVEIPVSGAHNHGGDNRPSFQGVLFVIRLW